MNDFLYKARLEILITEREAMRAANQRSIILKRVPVFNQTDFKEISNQMLELVKSWEYALKTTKA